MYARRISEYDFAELYAAVQANPRSQEALNQLGEWFERIGWRDWPVAGQAD